MTVQLVDRRLLVTIRRDLRSGRPPKCTISVPFLIFSSDASTSCLSEHLWELEQPAQAVANQYFVGAINRAGFEAPWNIGEFYGKSYFYDPRGEILAQGRHDKDELLTAYLDLDLIHEVRHVWQLFRDRQPESYDRVTYH